jgi:hypothetical protein
MEIIVRKYASMLNLIEEKKMDLNKKVNDKENTQYIEIYKVKYMCIV